MIPKRFVQMLPNFFFQKQQYIAMKSAGGFRKIDKVLWQQFIKWKAKRRQNILSTCCQTFFAKTTKYCNEKLSVTHKRHLQQNLYSTCWNHLEKEEQFNSFQTSSELLFQSEWLCLLFLQFDEKTKFVVVAEIRKRNCSGV